MVTLLRNLPQDSGTVAAVRQACDQAGLPASCRQRVCRRQRRCGARWRPHVDVRDRVLPPCLAAAQSTAAGLLADGEMMRVGVRRIVAEALQLEDPQFAAEGDDEPWWGAPLGSPNPFLDQASSSDISPAPSRR